MSKVLIPIIFLTFLVGQDNYKSIHQIELDFNKENYLEPLFKPYFGPANPIQPKKIKSSKKFLDIIHIGKGLNGNHTIMNYLLQLHIFLLKQMLMAI